MKKKNRNAGEKIDDAMKKAEQARNQSDSGDSQKVDEKQLNDIAKNLNGSDEQAKADAKKKLEKMMQDPKTGQGSARTKLEQMADKAGDPKQKQDLQNAAKEAGKMADQFAKKDPPKPESGKVDPKALEDAAKKLASSDPKTRQEAMDKIKEMAKDPKAAKEMQDKLKRDGQERQVSRRQESDCRMPPSRPSKLPRTWASRNTPKLNPDDLKNLAKKMAGNDPKAKEDAQKKLAGDDEGSEGQGTRP